MIDAVQGLQAMQEGGCLRGSGKLGYLMAQV